MPASSTNLQLFVALSALCEGLGCGCQPASVVVFGDVGFVYLSICVYKLSLVGRLLLEESILRLTSLSTGRA